MERRIRTNLQAVAMSLVAALAWACDSSAPDGPGSEVPGSEQIDPVGEAQAEQASEAPTTPGDPTEEAATEEPAEPEAVPTGWDETGFRQVYSFVDNRHRFHTFDTGLFVNFGHPSAYKYIQGRWRSPWQEGSLADGRPVAYTDGIGATFRFPLTDVSAEMELVLRMRAVGDDQRMDVFVNSDDALPTITTLPSEWDEVRVRLPTDRLNVGENKVRFHFRRSVATSEHGRTAGGFDYARIAPVDVNPPESHTTGAFGLLQLDDGSSALTAPVYGALAIYLTIPEEARLRLWASADLPAGTPTPAAIRLLIDGREPVVLWEGELTARPTPIDVDLSEHNRQVVRLELTGTAPIGEGALLWHDPILAVPERPARELVADQLPQNVLIWLIDAMRADHFVNHNPDALAETPNMTRFMESCVMFRRTSVQGNSSLPSSGSIHTGTYPPVHRIMSGDRRISRDLIVVGETIDAADWDTGLFSSNGYVSQSRGFGRGYDYYRNLIHEPGRPDSEYLWPIIREWIDGRGETSWFAFINTIDPHVPYDPPEELLLRYHPEPYNGRIRPRATGELLDGLGDGGMSDSDLRYLRALYLGEITYNDLWFGHMIDDLTERELLDDTLIIIMSDHGEGFMEHGRVGHGTGVNEEVTHIPLVFCHPRSLGQESGQATWIDTEAETIDLFPTLLDLFDIEVPPSVQGVSLVPLMLDPTPTMNRPGLTYHQDYLIGARLGRWKYHLRTGDDDNLYDLDESFIEGEDRRAEFPLAHRYMRDVMAFHLAFDSVWRKSEWGFANNHSAVFATQLDTAVW